jgi:hypothetical protein
MSHNTRLTSVRKIGFSYAIFVTQVKKSLIKYKTVISQGPYLP